MNTWLEDVEEWAKSNNRNPSKVEAICIRHGWNPEKYTSRMKDELFDWLDDWYTLSIKKLSKPATRYQKNPDNLYCPRCDNNISYIKRIYNGQMLGSCGDIFHDSHCICNICL